MKYKEFTIQYALGTLDNDYLCNIAYNPNTPIEILTILSKDENWDVRGNAKKNLNVQE